MLPDIRATILAVIAAVGLLTAAFAITATVRVAQESRASPLQAVRQGLLADAALRVEAAGPASVTSVGSPPAEAPPRIEPPVVSVAPALPTTVAAPALPPVIAPPPAIMASTPRPDVVPAPPAAVPAPAPAIVAAAPPVTLPPAPDSPATTGSIESAPHSGAPVAAVPTPDAEPPVGGPLQEYAALTPQAPDVKPVVKQKTRTVKRQRGTKHERARAAARRIAAEQARRRAAAAAQSQQQQFQQFPQAQPAFRN